MKHNQDICPTQSLPITTHIKEMIAGIIVLSKSRLAFFRAEQNREKQNTFTGSLHTTTIQGRIISRKMFNANLQPATVHSAAQTDAVMCNVQL